MARSRTKFQPISNHTGYALIYGLFDRAVRDLDDRDPINVVDAWLFLLNEQAWYEYGGLNKDKFIDLIMEG